MNKRVIMTTFIALILASQLVTAGEITDTYAAGNPLTADMMTNIATAVNNNNDFKHSPVTRTCPGGELVSGIDSGAGIVTCTPDKDTVTKYTPGTGISITDTTISVAPKNDAYTIPGNDFLPASRALFTDWGRYDIIGYGYPKTDAGFYTIKGIHLPSGAAINDVHCYFYDDNATYDIASYFFELRSTVFSAGTASIIATASGTATTGQSAAVIDVADTIITHTVNNSSQSYSLIVYFDASTGFTATTSSTLRLYGCTINYTR